MQVDLVSVQTSDGVGLDGALRTPAAGANTRLGLDLVIFHHGSMGNFYSPYVLGNMGDYLLEEGCAVLRVNNRGHHEVFRTPRGRLGHAFEIVDDCRLDWKAWLNLLRPPATVTSRTGATASAP